MTLGELLAATRRDLERAGVDSPRVDAELLVGHALGLSRLELYTSLDRRLGEMRRRSSRPFSSVATSSPPMTL